MKTILFDLFYSQPQGKIKFHGGGEYIKSIFSAMLEDHKVHSAEYSLEVCLDTSKYIDDWIKDAVENNGIKNNDVKSPDDIFDLVDKKAGECEEIRFFSGMIYPYFYRDFNKKAVTIGTCHGLRLLEKQSDPIEKYYDGKIKYIKELLLRKRHYQASYDMYKNALDKFDIIITDSLHSKYAIRSFYPQYSKQKSIEVCYAPPGHHVQINSSDTAKEPFILMMSANRWIKNSYRGVMALDELYKSGQLKGVKTKVFGGLPENIRARLKCRDMFEFRGYVEQEELEMAYRDCRILFYPTLNEGFGLPPYEAMKYGKTCVISAVCSLPEVYGEAVYLCNPYDIKEMENRILQAVSDPISEDTIAAKVASISERQRHDLDRLVSIITRG